MTGPDNRAETNDRGTGVGHSVAAAGPGSDISAPSEALLEQARRPYRQNAVEALITILRSGPALDEDSKARGSLIKEAKKLMGSPDKQTELLGIDLIGAFGSLEDRKELLKKLTENELDDQTKIRVIGALARESTANFEEQMSALYEALPEDKDHIAQYALFASDSKWRGEVQSQSASYKLVWILYNYFKNDYSDKPASSDKPPLIDQDRLKKISSLSESKNRLVKKGFLLSLAFAQSETSDQTLLNSLTSGDHDTKELALSAIIVAERLDLLPQIKEAAESDKIPLEYAIRAIYQLRDDESPGFMKQQIEKALKSDSHDQQSMALKICRTYAEILPDLDLTAQTRLALLNSLYSVVKLEFAKTFPQEPGSMDVLRGALTALESKNDSSRTDHIQKMELALLIGSQAGVFKEADKIQLSAQVKNIITDYQKISKEDLPEDLVQKLIDLAVLIGDTSQMSLMTKFASLGIPNLSEATMLKLAASGPQGLLALKALSRDSSIDKDIMAKAARYLSASPFKFNEKGGEGSSDSDPDLVKLRQSIMAESLGQILSNIESLDPTQKDEFIGQIIKSENLDYLSKALEVFPGDKDSTVRLISECFHLKPQIIREAAAFGVSLSDIRDYLKNLGADEKDSPTFKVRDLYSRFLTETNSKKSEKRLILTDLVQSLCQLQQSYKIEAPLAIISDLQNSDAALFSRALFESFISPGDKEKKVDLFNLIKSFYKVEKPNALERSPEGFHDFFQGKLKDFAASPASPAALSASAKWFLDLNDSLKKINLLTQEHLDPGVMQKVVKGREDLEAISKGSKETDLSKPNIENLVVFVARADWNGGIAASLNIFLRGVGEGKNILLFEVTSPSDIIEYSKQLNDAGIKADRIYISGHGFHSSIVLSSNDDALGLRTSGRRSKIHITDFPSLIKGGVGQILKPGGIVDFDACSNGTGFREANNIGNRVRDLFPRAGAYSTHSLGAPAGTDRIVNGRIIPVGTDSMLVPVFRND